MSDAVLCDPAARDSPWSKSLDEVAAGARRAVGDLSAAKSFARQIARTAPMPGQGKTLRLWEILATIAAVDLTVARVVEPHLDALSILSQSGMAGASMPPVANSTWGVFAAEGGGTRVEATELDGAWTLRGEKPWCSLAEHLDNALITAHTSPTERRLFLIDLSTPAVIPQSGGWVARGLSDVTSVSIFLEDAAATPVGGPGWYTSRPGFAWGGIGVAAIWWGAAVALSRAVHAAGRTREPDQIGMMLLGEIDVDLSASAAMLRSAADTVDAGVNLSRREQSVLAKRVRSFVSATAERTIERFGHALGPAPLVRDEEQARRVADLQIYVRQDHAERDRAGLGGYLLTEERAPW